MSPSKDFSSFESVDARSAGTLGFMPRLLVLTTLPHRRPRGHRFERVNGRYSLLLEARRSVGLPYGIYPRLILVYLTTAAVRSKSPEIHLGATANNLARKLGLSTVSGPRGTAHRLEDQLNRLLCLRLDWQTSIGLHPISSGSKLVTAGGAAWLKPLRRLLPRRPTWRSHIVLGQDFFEEITRSAVPVDLRALRLLQRSPLALDLYVWLTYRMSYLRRPTLVPWEGLQAQLGADYARLRDFRRKALAHLTNVICVYPALRVRQTDSGLYLYPSRPHVPARPRRQARRTNRR